MEPHVEDPFVVLIGTKQWEFATTAEAQYVIGCLQDEMKARAARALSLRGKEFLTYDDVYRILSSVHTQRSTCLARTGKLLAAIERLTDFYGRGSIIDYGIVCIVCEQHYSEPCKTMDLTHSWRKKFAGLKVPVAMLLEHASRFDADCSLPRIGPAMREDMRYVLASV